MNLLSWALLGLTAMQIIHLAEEIKTGFREQFPLGEMPRTVFWGINAALYSFCLALFLLALGDAPLVRPLAWGWAIVMMGNGAGHLGMMVVRRQYFPGGVTAPGLILAAGYVMVVLSR